MFTTFESSPSATRVSPPSTVAASPLPSGRTEYRQYVDYTDELDALASANPDIAREVTIGTSLEGRPIQGIEIAADVITRT